MSHYSANNVRLSRSVALARSYESLHLSYDGAMVVETAEELEGLRAAGRVVAKALRAMRAQVRPGITTAELDAVGARVFKQAGARSGPQLDYGFPGVNCISVNDEAVHGIPGPRRLRAGDLVKLDVTAELNSFYADACMSVPVGKARPTTTRLVMAAQRALRAGIEAARADAPLNVIGAAVEETVRARGFSVCASLTGHGIGRRIHEDPHVPNHYVSELSQSLSVGLVLTIEPIISAGTGAVHALPNGWTVSTSDGSRCAHVEHTVVIADGPPELLTV
jgi:methionyl aminopeptidase